MKYLISLLLICFVLSNLAAQTKQSAADDYNTIFKALKWRSIGPFRGGRSNCATGVVGDPKTYYMGTTGGGLWKTDDMGTSWRNVSDGFFKTLIAAYVRTAQDMLDRYQNDAAVNGLFFDRHAESLAIETFTDAIRTAAEVIIEDPLGAPLISAWDRVISAIPDILEKINDAVEEDNS